MPFSLLKKLVCQYFCHIMNVQVIGVWQSPQLCQLSAAPLCPPPFATTVSQSPSAATSNLSLFAGELKVSSPFTFVFSTLILYVLYSAFWSLKTISIFTLSLLAFSPSPLMWHLHSLYLFNPNAKHRDIYRLPQISQKIQICEFLLISPSPK